MNKNRPFGKTIRQELIDAASLSLRLGQAVTPGDATESVLDGVRSGTLGGMMKDYAMRLSDSGWRRLECEIKRKAR